MGKRIIISNGFHSRSAVVIAEPDPSDPNVYRIGERQYREARRKICRNEGCHCAGADSASLFSSGEKVILYCLYWR